MVQYVNSILAQSFLVALQNWLLSRNGSKGEALVHLSIWQTLILMVMKGLH